MPHGAPEHGMHNKKEKAHRTNARVQRHLLPLIWTRRAADETFRPNFLQHSRSD